MSRVPIYSDKVRKALEEVCRGLHEVGIPQSLLLGHEDGEFPTSWTML